MLHAFQSQFATAVLDPNADVRLVSQQIERKRFAVYRNNVLHALSEALAALFPVTRALIGTQAFLQSAAAYIRHRMPTVPALSAYGDTFPTYVATLWPQLTYLYDVAMLEHTYYTVSHAADTAVLTRADMTAIDRSMSADCMLRPVTAHALLHNTCAAGAIWHCHQENNTDGLAAISLENSPEYLQILRIDDGVVVRCLKQCDWQYLSLLKNHTIGSAAEKIGCEYPDFSLSQFFTRFLFDGTFCAVSHP